MINFDPFSWSVKLKWKASVCIWISVYLTLTPWDQWPVYSNENKFPNPYLALNCSPCHVYLATRPNLHLPVILHDWTPKTITNDENCPVSVFIKWTPSTHTFTHTSSLQF